MTAWRRRLLVPALGVATLALGVASVAPHRNLLRKIAHDAWWSPGSIAASLAFSSYWTSQARKLRYSPESGVWDFDWSSSEGAGMSGLERGKLAWHRGDFRAAIADLEEHQRLRGESEESLFWLAMSYLRQAEAQNCLAAASLAPGSSVRGGSGHRVGAGGNGKTCSLPLVVHHREKDLSRAAAGLFERLLERHDPENRLYRWLLSFCYMTVGGFPQEVPERYRIESEFIDAFYAEPSPDFAARTRHLAFRDVAPELGVAIVNSGKGVAVEDFDRDGYLDIVTGGHYSELLFLRNEGGIRFVDRSVEAGFAGIRGIHIITAADYDDDGWMDLFFSRPNDAGKGSFMLLRNRGDGSFSDVTASSGLLAGLGAAPPRIITWASAWADVENDGDLDLFVANFGLTNPLGDGPTLSSKLFLNQGGTFEDATERFGLGPLVRRQAIFGAAFGDFDDDGFPDLAVTHWSPGDGVLLRNLQGRSFEATDLVMPEDSGFMAAFLDADQDGDLDLFLGGSPGIAELITAQAVFGEGGGRRRDGGHSTLWLQHEGRFDAGNGFFARQLAIGTMGSSFGDLDNDGAYDFYLGTGNPEGWYILPNLMYLGATAGGRPVAELTDISRLFGFGTVQKGHGIVFFDFDNDGDQDVYSSLGGMWPGDAWPNQLFLNESSLDAAWVQIRLRGDTANSYGLGARIKVVARDAQGREIVRYDHMDNKTGFGSAPYLAHIGLGDAVAIDRVEVRWPGDERPRAYAAEPGRIQVLAQRQGSRI